jgi:hypothetical protein
MNWTRLETPDGYNIVVTESHMFKPGPVLEDVGEVYRASVCTGPIGYSGPPRSGHTLCLTLQWVAHQLSYPCMELSGCSWLPYELPIRLVLVALPGLRETNVGCLVWRAPEGQPNGDLYFTPSECQRPYFTCPSLHNDWPVFRCWLAETRIRADSSPQQIASQLGSWLLGCLRLCKRDEFQFPPVRSYRLI